MTSEKSFCQATSVNFIKTPEGSMSNIFEIDNEINQVKFDVPITYIPASYWHFKNDNCKDTSYIGVFPGTELSNTENEFQLIATGKLYELNDASNPAELDKCISLNKYCKMIIAGNNKKCGGVFGFITHD